MKEFGEWLNSMANSIEDCSGATIGSSIMQDQRVLLKTAYNETMEELGYPDDYGDLIDFIAIMKDKILDKLCSGYIESSDNDKEEDWFKKLENVVNNTHVEIPQSKPKCKALEIFNNIPEVVDESTAVNAYKILIEDLAYSREYYGANSKPQYLAWWENVKKNFEGR